MYVLKHFYTRQKYKTHIHQVAKIVKIIKNEKIIQKKYQINLHLYICSLFFTPKVSDMFSTINQVTLPSLQTHNPNSYKVLIDVFEIYFL